MPNENLQFNRVEDSIYELVFSQPARRNAVNAQMWKDLPVFLNEAKNTQGLKVLIIRGEGDHFVSGADISEFGELYATAKSAKKISKSMAEGLEALASFPLPTVAMIRGSCIGAGCGLALCCDIRFADVTSKFGITPGKLGLVYPYADVKRLIETVGLPNAKDILLSARIIKSDSAEKIGLIHNLVEAKNLESVVLKYTRDIAALSTHSSLITKKMFAAFQEGQTTENNKTMGWFQDGFVSDDFAEGYSAFLEKRKPNFKS